MTTPRTLLCYKNYTRKRQFTRHLHFKVGVDTSILNRSGETAQVVNESMSISPSTLLYLDTQAHFSEAEIVELWKAFLSPSPWHVLLHASIPNATWLQHALS